MNLTARETVLGGLVLALLVVVALVLRRAMQLRDAAARQGRDAELRLQLTSRLLRGEDVQGALDEVALALREMFELQSCTLRHGDAVAIAGAPGPPTLRFESGGVVLEACASDALTRYNQAQIEALVAGLATALDRLRLESEVRDARMTAAVGQQRAGFLSAVSHNLRTPLTSVRAAASTLLSSWSRLEVEERRELVELIYDESDRLERLVRNTLELSRIRAGGLERNPEPVDVADLVRHAVRRLAPISRKHLVRLQVDDALPEVMLDVAMMEQILLNLLENALRFAPPGSEILVTAAPHGDAHWSLRILDHGPGVAPAARDHVFEEFVSSDGRLGSSGTGLGLAIVRSLVVAEEGAVRCEETPGGGATFVCTFPLTGGPLAANTRDGA